ncbi:MAG: (deoxy)nucleoside triphosphate pyrophosphohydrolase [Myxococcota bacterium]
MTVLRVVAAVMPGERPGEVLVFRRAPHKDHGGLWEFPGGKVEPGETEPEALAREIREELGLDVEVGRRLWAGEAEAGRPLQVAFWEVTPAAGRPSLVDHDAMRSVGPAGFGSLPWAPVDDAFVTWLGERRGVAGR